MCRNLSLVWKKLEAIFLKYEQDFWAEKLCRVRQAAEYSDGYCVQLFLGLFGGIGRFNDLVLEATASAKNELAAERVRAYEIEQALK